MTKALEAAIRAAWMAYDGGDEIPEVVRAALRAALPAEPPAEVMAELRRV